MTSLMKGGGVSNLKMRGNEMGMEVNMFSGDVCVMMHFLFVGVGFSLFCVSESYRGLVK